MKPPCIFLPEAKRRREPQMQLTMFTPLSQKIVDRLREADLNHLTPLDAHESVE